MKRVIGQLLFLISGPLIIIGCLLFVLNLAFSSINLGTNTGSLMFFANSILVVGLGFLARIIGHRLSNIR